MKVILSVMLSVLSVSAVADTCRNEIPGLIESANVLTEKFETLDEALHERNAPEKLIGIIHHFEEGVLEFVKELENGARCREAIQEFQHFHEDVQLLYRGLKERPEIFYQSKVLNAWNELLPSFVRFQNRLYRALGRP